MTASPKISVTSKLDGIRSWSLEALETCPGAVGADACKGCYATTGNYLFANVKAPRAHNKQDWKEPDWVRAMVIELQKDTYFRWFDSGDMYDLNLAQKILSVMFLTPRVKHWLPTRMEKFEKFHAVINAMRSLPNAVVRFSSDSVIGEFVPGVHGSTITSGQTPSGVFSCEAYTRGGKCGGCRACYDKAVPVIAYPAHGVKMKKVIRILGH